MDKIIKDIQARKKEYEDLYNKCRQKILEELYQYCLEHEGHYFEDELIGTEVKIRRCVACGYQEKIYNG